MPSAIRSLAALAVFTIVGPTSAAVLFSDNFNTAGAGPSGVNFGGSVGFVASFNATSALAADQSGTAATKDYKVSVGGGWDGAFQRGNGGNLHMYAGAGNAGSTNMRASLNYNITAAANTLSSALEIQFNMGVINQLGADGWTSFTLASTQNPFVNEAAVGFGSLFRVSGVTQQFDGATGIGSTATFTNGDLITFVISDATGSGSAFNSDGATDIVKMYVGTTLTNTWTNLDLTGADKYISFHANSTVANIDNLTITATNPAYPFAAWMSTNYPDIVYPDNQPGADPDNDGTTNLMEYVLQGDPSASTTGTLPTLDASGANSVFTYLRRSATSGTTQTFQYGTDLIGWTPVAIPGGEGVVVTPNTPSAGIDTVTITLPASTGPQVFGRLKVSIPDFDLLLEPFWESTTMVEEPLLFAEQVVGQPPTATLLFPPENIIEVKSANGEFTYQDGIDYTVNRLTGLITLLPGTAIPSKSYGEIYPPANSALPNKIGHKRGDETTFLIFSEGRYFHDLQVSVTYTHGANAWNGSIPMPAGSNLPKLMAKLQAKAPVTICQSGDSISFGANASGMINAPPFLPSYGELVALGLEKKFGSKINLRNFAVGGWQSQNGVADAGAVAAEKPDLVIIAYGMNDAFGVSTATYIANINAIMNKIRETSPDAEFILVASMLPNAEWHALNMESFSTYRDALAAACGTGVVMADMTSVWEELLTRKSYLDITGNGVNHPNDFGHRLYGQVILKLISNES